MTSFSPEFYFSMLLLAAVIGLRLWVAGVLLRERSVAAWLMLAGSVLWAAGVVAVHVNFLRFALDYHGSPYVVPEGAQFSSLGGMLLFSGAFLLHAWRRESLERRIAELEAALEKIGRDRSSRGE